MVVGVGARGMGLLREALGTEMVLPPVATRYSEALVELRKVRPNVVITGFDDDFDQAVQLGPLLGTESPGLTLVALSEVSDPERIRSAMRAGYREYVILPDDGRLLRQAIYDAGDGGMMSGLAISEYFGIRPDVIDTTMVGGSSYEFHAAHARRDIAAGHGRVALLTYGSTSHSNAFAIGTGGRMGAGPPTPWDNMERHAGMAKLAVQGAMQTPGGWVGGVRPTHRLWIVGIDQNQVRGFDA